MKIEKSLKFLSVRTTDKQNKDKSGKYTLLALNALDEDNNVCVFFVYNSDLVDKILKSDLVSLEDFLAQIDVSFYNGHWNVRLFDIS